MMVWPILSQRGPLKEAPQLKARGFPCSREEKEQVKQKQRAAGSWTVLRLCSWSTQTLLPNSSARQNPGTALQTDKQQPASTALHALTNILLDVRSITIHCYCSFTACVSKLQSSVSLTGVICKQQRWVIFPRKHLLDIFYFKSDSKVLSSASKILDKQHKITNRVQLTRDCVPVSHLSQQILSNASKPIYLSESWMNEKQSVHSNVTCKSVHQSDLRRDISIMKGEFLILIFTDFTIKSTQ